MLYYTTAHRRTRRIVSVVLLTGAFGLAVPAMAANHEPAAPKAPATPKSSPAGQSAEKDGPVAVAMKGPSGADLGTVEVTSTPLGLLLNAKLTGLPDGPHAFHIHETGVCDGDFSSAGDHYNPDGKSHGFLAENGPHPGDMTNFVVTNGTAQFEEFNATVTLAGARAPLNDVDGSAIVIHGDADDYVSQPSGDAGARIACGVVYAAKN